MTFNTAEVVCTFTSIAVTCTGGSYSKRLALGHYICSSALCLMFDCCLHQRTKATEQTSFDFYWHHASKLSPVWSNADAMEKGKGRPSVPCSLVYTAFAPYLCMYLRTVHMCVCECVCTYACVYVHMHVCMYICMYVCTYVRTNVCMYVCTYKCMCLLMCVCTVCTYIWIDGQLDGWMYVRMVYADMYVGMHCCQNLSTVHCSLQ